MTAGGRGHHAPQSQLSSAGQAPSTEQGPPARPRQGAQPGRRGRAAGRPGQDDPRGLPKKQSTVGPAAVLGSKIAPGSVRHGRRDHADSVQTATEQPPPPGSSGSDSWNQEALQPTLSLPIYCRLREEPWLPTPGSCSHQQTAPTPQLWGSTKREGSARAALQSCCFSHRCRIIPDHSK